ncbi:unnamed protein product [Cylindrotheca closterium]|uniref:Beta-glucosidase n=1 Tax=Cylindrotheca closterium TaxID=2856 RepID=A0AAD2G3A2_9STRA|nr:unnamed protein product [Cylindrotheca closterium]
MVESYFESPTERSGLLAQPNEEPAFEGSSSKTKKAFGICVGSSIVLIVVASLIMVMHMTDMNNNKLRMESSLLEKQNQHHRFPSDFVWGAATSAYQIEGAAYNKEGKIIKSEKKGYNNTKRANFHMKKSKNSFQLP